MHKKKKFFYFSFEREKDRKKSEKSHEKCDFEPQKHTHKKVISTLKRIKRSLAEALEKNKFWIILTHIRAQIFFFDRKIRREKFHQKVWVFCHCNFLADDFNFMLSTFASHPLSLSLYNISSSYSFLSLWKRKLRMMMGKIHEREKILYQCRSGA